MNCKSHILFWAVIFTSSSWKFPFLDYTPRCISGVNGGSIVRPVIKYEVYKTLPYDDQESNSFEFSGEGQEIQPLSEISSIPVQISTDFVPRSRVSRSVPESTTQTTEINRGASNYISRRFPSPFRGVRLYKFWLPSLLSETVLSDDWYGSEAIIEYKPSVLSIQNITKATLNMTVSVDEASSQVAILLYGSYSLLTTDTNANSSDDNASVGASRLLYTLLPQFHSNSQKAELSFLITDFIKEASYINTQQSLSAAQKVKITFAVRRQCNSIDSSECTYIVDLDPVFPYLRVDYKLNV